MTKYFLWNSGEPLGKLLKPDKGGKFYSERIVDMSVRQKRSKSRVRPTSTAESLMVFHDGGVCLIPVVLNAPQPTRRSDFNLITSSLGRGYRFIQHVHAFHIARETNKEPTRSKFPNFKSKQVILHSYMRMNRWIRKRKLFRFPSLLVTIRKAGISLRTRHLKRQRSKWVHCAGGFFISTIVSAGGTSHFGDSFRCVLWDLDLRFKLTLFPSGLPKITTNFGRTSRGI